MVVLNNISPLKTSMVRTPRRISYVNEVNNKLPLILVEKIKLPRLITSSSNSRANSSNNISKDNASEETIKELSFVEEMSILYHNNNNSVNEKYSSLIAILNRISDVDFDVFKLSELTNGMELFVMMNHLFRLYNFESSLNIPKKDFNNYFSLVNKSYRKNSYHNSIHGCDVTQTFYFLIKTCNIETVCSLSDLEILSCFFASSIHDLDHPGNNNNYEINVGSRLALSYNDKAVLENYHLCKAFSLMKKPDSNFMANLKQQDYNISRAMVINMVLATDMADHFPDLGRIEARTKSADFNPSGCDKQFMLNQLIHASDISNPIKPLDIYMNWINRIFTEFYIQGDKERVKGLNISYLCDRHTVNIPDSQVNFINGIVMPLYERLAIPFGNFKLLINLLKGNRDELVRLKKEGYKFECENGIIL